MASINDKITNTLNGVNPLATTAASPRNAGATTLICTDLTGWPTSSAVHFATYQAVDGAKVAGTQVDWKAVRSGSSLINMTIQNGTDAGNTIGDIVEMMPTAAWAQDLAEALTQEHDRGGTHAAITPTSVTTASATITNETVTTSNVTTANITTGNVTTLAVSGHATFNDGGILGQVRTYTGSATWSKPSGLKFVIVECVGGGGGAGAGGLTGGSTNSAGGGGNAGYWSIVKKDASALSSSETVTVGTGGAGGSSGVGTDGNTSSFGTYCVAQGGKAGTTRTSSTIPSVGGQTAHDTNVSSGDIVSPGAIGDSCFLTIASVGAIGGKGGDSRYGSGGRPASSNAGTDATGSNGQGYGAGGSGGINFDNVTPAAGGNGAAGIVIVYEYY